MITESGFKAPLASASSIMVRATRSFTDPAGLNSSSLARILAFKPSFSSIWVSSNSGVCPMS